MTEYLCVIDYHLLYILLISIVSMGFQWLSGKESARQTGDPGSIPGLGISCEEVNGNPLQYRKSHGQRSLVS